MEHPGILKREIKAAKKDSKVYVINIGTYDLSPEQGAKLVAGK